MADPGVSETGGRTHRLPVVEAGEHNHPVGDDRPVDTPVEVVGDNSPPVHHSIGRWPRGEGLLFRAESLESPQNEREREEIP